MARRQPDKRFLVLYVLFHLAVVAVTWSDISRRADNQVRGNKTIWRIASVANTGGAVAYWLIGRRHPTDA